MRTNGITTGLFMPITSRWIIEKGYWDHKLNDFTSRTTEEFTRKIKMTITANDHGEILRFIGGPTGHESYYLADLLENKKNDGEFCICAGTINRWPACYVERKTVLDFIKKALEYSGSPSALLGCH